MDNRQIDHDAGPRETMDYLHAECHIKPLKHIWLEITTRCNLACVHCYNQSGPDRPLHQQMKDADWLRVLYESREFGCASVQFIGGEPTLHPGLQGMLGYAHELGFENIEVFTNATTITQQKAELFRTFGTKVACSFYSIDKDVHDRITQKSGSFDKTIEGISRALDYQLTLRVALVQLNQSDNDVEETVSFLRNLGIATIKTDKVRAIGRAAGVNGMEREDSSEFPRDKAEFYDLCGNCGAGYLCVTAMGEILPCIMARKWRVGTVEEGIRAASQGDALQAFLSLKRLHMPVPGCSCDPRPDCPPECPPRTGDCYPDCYPM